VGRRGPCRPAGQLLCRVHPSQQPGPDDAAGGFSWHELATAAALRFYGQLFGWTKGAGHDMGAMGVYQLFEQSGATVGGMCNTQGPSTPPSWLSYVHVADSSRAVGAVKAAGGRLLHGPVEVPGGSWIALFMDPQGGAFAVHEMPRAVGQAPSGAAATATRRPRMKAALRKAAVVKLARKKAAKKAVKKKAAKRAAKKAVRRAKKTVRRVKRVARKTVRRVARKRTRARGRR
jgi:predicted enzyme related to lactoylglutathione lyase